MHEGSAGKGAVKHISASAAPQMCPMKRLKQRLPRRLPRRFHIAFSPEVCAGHTLRASTAPPAGEIYSPAPSCDASSSCTEGTLRSKQQTENRAQGGGVYSAWKKRSDCPQGWGLRICLRRSAMSGRRGRRAKWHRSEPWHRPHFAELLKPEYTPPPRYDVNQPYRLSVVPAHGRV